MIESLTKEQTDLFPVYVKKYIDLSLNNHGKRSQEDAERDFGTFQRVILQKKDPAPVVIFDSPAKCWEYIEKVVANGEKVPFVYPYFDCQFWSQYFAYYDYIHEVLKVEYPNMAEYTALRNCFEYGMVWPLEQACVVCQKFTICERNTAGQLHCESGPALSYSGDNEIWALNGVVMDKKWITTPAEEIDINDVLRETNVEIRRELLRKIGIERALDKLPHKILDTQGTYTLYSINLGEAVPDARYLRMENPSIGVWHLEGVAPTIKTVGEALEWRNNGMFRNADVLT